MMEMIHRLWILLVGDLEQIVDDDLYSFIHRSTMVSSFILCTWAL